jgi:hypothetical protein
MTDPRLRSSYESIKQSYTKAAGRRAVRTAIGQELNAHYEIPQDVPQEILAFLMHLTAPHED